MCKTFKSTFIVEINHQMNFLKVNISLQIELCKRFLSLYLLYMCMQYIYLTFCFVFLYFDKLLTIYVEPLLQGVSGLRGEREFLGIRESSNRPQP